MTNRTWEEPPQVPTIVSEWIDQLRTDRLLHRLVAEAAVVGEQMDVELVCTLRANAGRIVLMPRISVRR